ncbi:MAG: hydrogenase iron-sulfur subunit [Dehalococcoidales bacterium]|nr:hydrogenase iron-sulfur subunit [Dehalococcoidales bacterium]
MDAKARVYICTGCGIGEALDIAALRAVAESEYGAKVSEHPHLCSPEGVAMIRADREAEGFQKVAIAACSLRVNAEAFALNNTVVERVNLREQVAWSHTPGDEETQALAEDQLRMSIVKMTKTELPEITEKETEQTVLVVGGGIAGLTAALEVANAKRQVVLVEQKPELGGWLTEFHQVSPGQAPYRDPEKPPLAATLAAVRDNPLVQVLTGTTIDKVAGQPGDFTVTASTNGTETQMRAGAIVLATGWRPYDATKLGHLGFGLSPDVITNVMLEQQVKAGRISRPSDGKAPENVVFVQCAGSRDEEHLPYCSGVCCQVSLKQALYVREQYPDANIFILHKDIRTPAQYEEFYKRVQEDDQVFFLRGDVTGVSTDGNGGLVVSAEDTQLGEAINLPADLVVLATGMVPNVSETLNLQYRQGPDMPSAHHGFADSNFICWPYETQRTAIFAAGCVREPMNVTGCVEDAAGAGLRAAQATTLVAAGQALHPRIGDNYFPNFFLQRCTQCKRCTEECPFGALNEDAKGTPELNPNRCRRCGICLGACPERIVNFKNFSIDQIGSMIKAVEVPEEDEEKPRILVFACENDAYPALDLAGARRLSYSAAIRIIPLRCLGSMNTVWIADAVGRGFDGVLLLGCKYGDDYQCHFIRGSELANRRMENVRETLGRLRVEQERVRLEQVTMDDWKRLPALIDEFVAEMTEIGPNPYKGF